MAIEPITAGVSLVGLILDQRAKAQAANQAIMDRRDQQRNADKQFRFATAGRTDAYGNKQRYDDLLNEWIMELTPTQQALIKSGEREQLLGLTKDAAQNRTIRERAGARGRNAGQDYNRELSGYRNAGPKSELSIRDELTSLLAGSAGARSRGGQGSATQALRTGGSLPDARGASESAGSSLADIMLQARQMAMGETGQRQQAHQSRYLPALQSLMQTMDAGGNAPVQFSTTPDKLAGQQSEGMQLILNALQSGGKQVGAAGANLSKALGNTAPDFRGLASIMSAMEGNSGGRRAINKETAAGREPWNVPDTDPWASLRQSF